MKKCLLIIALCATPAFADPLDLNDYNAIFADNQGDVEVLSDTRSILAVGAVTLLRDTNEPREYTGIDESGEGAVGCFVSILATIQSALLACEVSLPDEQTAIQSTYLNEAMQFYVDNAVPAPDRATVQDRFDALVASQIEGARPFCGRFDIVTDLADRLFTPDSRAEVTGMMSIPRLPVANPCL